MRGEKNNGFLVQGMILAGAGILTRLIGIIYRIPVNNILGDEGQGFYGCAFSIYNIALLLTSYSLPVAVSKLVSARIANGEYRNASRLLKCALLFAAVTGALAAVLVFIFSDAIADGVMNLHLSVYALRVLAPGLFIVAVMGVLRGFFQGMGSMIPTALSQIAEQIVNAIVSIIGASYLIEIGKKAEAAKKNHSVPAAYGAAGGTLGTVTGALVGLAFLIFVFAAFYPTFKRKVTRDIFTRRESYASVFKTLTYTVAPVMLSTAIYNISDTVDQGVFSNIMAAQGHGEKEIASLLGMFTGKYNTMINIPLAIANALGAALIPSLTAALATGSKKRVNRKINTVLRFVLIIAIPCFVGFLVMAEPILDLFYGGNIKLPATMLRIGAISVVFYALSTVTNAVLQGIDRLSAPVKHGAISFAVHEVALIIMLAGFRWGIYAVVVSNIIFSLTMCILNARTLRKATRYRQELWRSVVLPLFSAGVMGLAAFAVSSFLNLIFPKGVSTVLSILVAAAVYAAVLLKSGALTAGEISSLPYGEKICAFLERAHLLKEKA